MVHLICGGPLRYEGVSLIIAETGRSFERENRKKKTTKKTPERLEEFEMVNLHFDSRMTKI